MQKINIKQLTTVYRNNDGTNLDWAEVAQYLQEGKYMRRPINMDTEYQRGLCWTEIQKREYIEYRLRGGCSGRHIYLNCPNYRSPIINTEWHETFEVVDGKQRLTAVGEFMADKIKVFGGYLASQIDMVESHVDLIFVVNNLKTPAAVVDWYMAMNTGGSVHTEEQLNIARKYKASL